ncbi:uncharacterized protein LOC134181661 [Corticium candelabrum]|uniref:uncharacterized protein LOC134181661 n=1 Tax=Corticium candelabrum TaxID=121492 RepID=UPI002E2534D3|nr:uncharacterized protein LOC134181661 [Corticium candelabrum]
MLCKTRGDSHNATTQNPTNWKFRLVVISIVDVICWWPACILYVIPFATGTSVYSGNYSPEYSEPVLVLVAAVTVANPILYVIMAKDFTTATRKFCWRHCVCLDRFNKDQEYIRTVTGVDIRVYDSTSGPTDTTKLLSENSRTEDTKYGYRSI